MEIDLDNVLAEQIVWAIEPFRPLAIESGNAVSHERFLQRPDLWPRLRLIKAAQVTQGLPAVVLSTWSFSPNDLPSQVKSNLSYLGSLSDSTVPTGSIPTELAVEIAEHARPVEPRRTWQEVLQDLHPAR